MSDENDHDPSAPRAARLAAVAALLGLAGLALAWGSGGPAAWPAWGRRLGAWGPPVYAAAYALAVVALAPAAPLTLGAGALFGPVLGACVASAGATTGAALAFLTSRYVARDAVRRRFGRGARFRALDDALARGGWKVVALLRLSPLVPFNLQNYAYGLTRIGFWPCLLTSAVAMLPATFVYAAIGAAGRSGLEAAAGGKARTPGEWALLAAGLLATLGAAGLLTRTARAALGAPGEAPSQPK